MKRSGWNAWLALCLVTAAALWLAAWCTPMSQPVMPPATVTPTVRVIVLPTFTPAPPVTMLVTPVVPVIDLLPRETATRAPTLTETPAPTATPVSPTPDKPAVQRG